MTPTRTDFASAFIVFTVVGSWSLIALRILAEVPALTDSRATEVTILIGLFTFLAGLIAKQSNFAENIWSRIFLAISCINEHRWVPYSLAAIAGILPIAHVACAECAPAAAQFRGHEASYLACEDFTAVVHPPWLVAVLPQLVVTSGEKNLKRAELTLTPYSHNAISCSRLRYPVHVFMSYSQSTINGAVRTETSLRSKANSPPFRIEVDFGGQKQAFDMFAEGVLLGLGALPVEKCDEVRAFWPGAPCNPEVFVDVKLDARSTLKARLFTTKKGSVASKCDDGMDVPPHPVESDGTWWIDVKDCF